MLGEGHFKYWKLPHNVAYTVLWVKLSVEEQINFLDWCFKSGIKLYSHIVTDDYLLPTLTNYKKLKKGHHDGVEVNYEATKDSLRDLDKKSHTMWYMIESENCEDHLMLMKLKWS